MILGIEKVVRLHEVEAGRFYLSEQYDDDARLFLCVRSGRQVEGEAELMALFFDVGKEDLIVIERLPYEGPLVVLPNIQVRVDAPSMKESSTTSTVRKNMLLVSGEQVYLACSSGPHGWSLVDLESANVLKTRSPEFWVSFERWRLVMVDGDEEVALAAFGES